MVRDQGPQVQEGNQGLQSAARGPGTASAGRVEADPKLGGSGAALLNGIQESNVRLVHRGQRIDPLLLHNAHEAHLFALPFYHRCRRQAPQPVSCDTSRLRSSLIPAGPSAAPWRHQPPYSSHPLYSRQLPRSPCKPGDTPRLWTMPLPRTSRASPWCPPPSLSMSSAAPTLASLATFTTPSISSSTHYTPHPPHPQKQMQ